MKKRLPPYAKRAAAYPDAVLIGLRIYLGQNAWEKAQADPGGLCIPDGDSPLSFAWPVRGLVTTVVVTSPVTADRLRDMAAALLMSGAEAPVFMLEGERVSYYVPEVRRVA